MATHPTNFASHGCGLNSSLRTKGVYIIIKDINSSVISKLAVTLCTSSKSSNASINLRSDRAFSGVSISTVLLGIQRVSDCKTAKQVCFKTSASCSKLGTLVNTSAPSVSSSIDIKSWILLRLLGKLQTIVPHQSGRVPYKLLCGRTSSPHNHFRPDCRHFY